MQTDGLKVYRLIFRLDGETRRLVRLMAGQRGVSALLRRLVWDEAARRGILGKGGGDGRG
jgi:hypothetical protein